MNWIRTTLLTAALTAFMAPAPLRAAKPTNVILIMADDIGQECYESYGGTSYQTPELNRVAERGMTFRHAYSNPLCTPTRIKIMTGLSNVRNYAAFSVLRRSERTVGHVLRDAGYRTAIAGKWQLYGASHYSEQFRGKGTLPEDAGFERHCLWQVRELGSRYWGPTMTIDGQTQTFPEDVYGPDISCQYLLDRMEEYRNEPFFLYYPMALVHSPFVPTPASADRQSTRKKQNFADMVQYMDTIIGRIVRRTEELGIAEHTLILITGDNGTHTSITSQQNGHAVKGGKGRPTNAGTHVALYALQPGTVPAGAVCDDLVEFSDFLPTLADAAAAPLTAATDGISFLPQLHGETGQLRETIFVYYWPRPEKGEPLRFVRDKRWKLYGDGRLYDISKDIRERSPFPADSRMRVRHRLGMRMRSMPAAGQTLLQYD